MMEMEIFFSSKHRKCFSIQATPSENFHFQAIVSKVSSSHRIFVMSPENIIHYIHIIHSHAHTHSLSQRQLLQDHPIFYSMIWFIRVSCVRKIQLFSLLCFSQLNFPVFIKKIHTFLSEDDLVVSLLAVIRSGYPVFSKQRPRSFTYSAIALFPRKKIYKFFSCFS